MHKQIKTRYGIPLPLVTLTLLFGNWRMLFTHQKLKVMIAEVLNYCVTDENGENSTLSGYLITKDKLHLVFNLTELKTKTIISDFKDKLKIEIDLEIARLKKKEIANDQKEILIQFDLFKYQFFEEIELLNEPLIRFLTGQRVWLPYASVKLERLKKEVQKSRFSSAIDYSEAFGPVPVNVLKTKQN